MIIKSVHVKVTFPGGRVVTGMTNIPITSNDKPIQVWLNEGGSDSVIINPSLAETIELTYEYEK